MSDHFELPVKNGSIMNQFLTNDNKMI